MLQIDFQVFVLQWRDYYYIVILTEFLRCSDMLSTAWTDLSEELFLKEDTLLTQIRFNLFLFFYIISFINLKGLMNAIY